MDNELTIKGFMATSELYFKMTGQAEEVITVYEIEILISNIDNSNLANC
jgi:hypothetical protein